jgi:hypothetical protein
MLPLGGLPPLVAGRAGRGAADVSITLELDCRRYLDDRAALVGYLRQERQKCRDLLDGAPSRRSSAAPTSSASLPAPHEDDADQPTVGRR